MPIDPTRVKALFLDALDLPDPLDRPGFLDRECGDDRESRARLHELLAAYDRPATELGRPLAIDREGETAAIDGSDSGLILLDEAETSPEPTEGHRAAEPSPVGGVIAGRYKIREEIGEGGMGSVYLAEQTQPVKRQVALKLIKAGMDSRTVLARFESERQALALMDHPHIAKVLDAGSTEQGRPYFVMELVKGIPLTDYCDAHRLDLPARLALFRQICSAVQHAHQKGIIHRDLKPTNILVESHDGKPVPKVIDFGLAKATSGMQLTEHSLFTAFGSVTGTPLYMAPEQANFNALDVDTRADIYSLGVILYELLTGTTPIRRDSMRRAALDEMLRVIREDEPPTPSSRISTSEALPSLAANRHIEPTRLSRFVRGDLDWIVMKALAKERARRYDSAIGLANDIERFTNHEPVSAGPPSSSYRLRKFIRRNRTQAVAASLVLLALVGGVVGTTLGLFEARRQEREARRRLAQVEKANEILGSIFADLNPRGGQSSEKGDKPLTALLGSRLDQATAQIEGEAIGDTRSVANMQMILGDSQLGLGYPERAIGLFTKARATLTAQLGPNDWATLTCVRRLAESYLSADRPGSALSLFQEVLGGMKALYGPDNHETLLVLAGIAECHREVGRLDRALPLLEQVFELRKARYARDNPFTVGSMTALANGYRAAGRLDRALPLFEQAIPLMKAKLGPDHPNVLVCMNDLGLGYQLAGKFDLALPMLEQAFELSKARYGPDHPETLTCMSNLGNSYSAAGDLGRAVPLSEQTLALRKVKLGPDYPNTLISMGSLGVAYAAAGDLGRAVPLFEETFGLMKAKLGPDHPDTLTLMGNLARGYLHVGKVDLASPLFEQALALSKAKLGPDHPFTLALMKDLAESYRADDKLDRALPLFEQALALSKAKLEPDHPLIPTIMNDLADGHEAAGRLDRAEPLLREMVDLRRRQAGSDSPQYSLALAVLARDLVLQRRWTDAEPILHEALKIRELKEPDSWLTFNTRSVLGGALLGQKKYAEAEPLLRAGYEGMKARADKIPSKSKIRAGEALDRLIELAEATDKPDEAKVWRDEKAGLLAPKPPDGKKS